MISDAAIRDSLATLAQLKAMHRPTVRRPGATRIVRPQKVPYVRSAEDLERMERIKQEIAELERAK